ARSVPECGAARAGEIFSTIAHFRLERRACYDGFSVQSPSPGRAATWLSLQGSKTTRSLVREGQQKAGLRESPPLVFEGMPVSPLPLPLRVRGALHCPPDLPRQDNERRPQ